MSRTLSSFLHSVPLKVLSFVPNPKSASGHKSRSPSQSQVGRWSPSPPIWEPSLTPVKPCDHPTSVAKPALMSCMFCDGILHVLVIFSSNRCSITTLNQPWRENTVLPLVSSSSTAPLVVKLIDARESHTLASTHTRTCRLKIAAALPFCTLSCWGTHPLPRWSPAHRCWSVP